MPGQCQLLPAPGDTQAKAKGERGQINRSGEEDLTLATDTASLNKEKWEEGREQALSLSVVLTRVCNTWF